MIALAQGQRAERKLLITVAEWKADDGRFYVLQTSQPADWDTEYDTYYTYSTDTYSLVTSDTAPTWQANTYYTRVERELLGTRTPDSSIAYNPEIENSTDILGNNYADVNKTQPQQDFDPYLILGGSKLGPKLNDIRRRNALSELNQFTIYIITAFDVTITPLTTGSLTAYNAERHVECTIVYQSIGGESNVNFPISVYFSNKITLGTVDKLEDGFVFTEA